MPRTHGATGLSRSVQREIVLDALRGARIVDISSEYEVSPGTVHRLRHDAMRDPVGVVEELREELAFRQEVAEILD